MVTAVKRPAGETRGKVAAGPVAGQRHRASLRPYMSPVSSLTGTPCLCGALFSGLGQAEGPALASSGRRVPLPGLVVRFVGMVEVAGQPVGLDYWI
jgi:hypothetical protein